MNDISTAGSRTELKSDNSNNSLFDNDYYYVNRSGDRIDIYLFNELEWPHIYSPLCDLIRNAPHHMEVNIRIQCYGGQIDTLIPLYTAIKESPAYIKGVIERSCASAATMLFLSCDGWGVNPYSTMMFHAYSSGYYGKRNENISDFEFNKEHLDTLVYDMYEGFLTKKEIDQVLDGKDLHFGYEEIIVRLEKLQKYREREAKKQGA